MDSSPPQTLHNRLREIIQWIQKSYFVYERNKEELRKKHLYRVNVPCSLSHLKILRKAARKPPVYKFNVTFSVSHLRILCDYVSSLGVDSDFSPQMYERWWRNEVWDGRSNPENCEQVGEMVVCFLNDLKELFTVPKVQHEELNQNDLVAKLVDFLSLLHKDNKYLSAATADHVFKELKWIVSEFRDKKFQAIEHEQVQYLSTQFEELVNKAGRYVHHYIFSSDQVLATLDEFLLEPIRLLKHNTIEFFKTLPNLATSKVAYHDGDSVFFMGSLLDDLEDSMNTSDNPLIKIEDQIEKLHQGLSLSWPLLEEHTSKVAYHDVDSFFIIGSLLDDLEDSMNTSDNPLIEIEDQIEKLHQGLSLSWPLLEEHLENKEFKEIAMQLRDMAYGVEYLINSFSVGDVPIRHLSIRLEYVIHHIGLISTRAQKMKKNYDAIRAAESFGIQQSKHGKRVIEMDDVTIGFDNKENNILDQQSLRGGRDIKIDDDIMVGFENEETNILDQLLGETQDLQIISIIGTPGLGKTTLAKKLHHHRLIGNRFDRHCWCVVSEVYRRKTLLIDILKNLGEKVETDIDEQSAKLRIHKVLYGRRYLITLDDLWTSNVWDDLQNCFPNERNGSRILITSRNREAIPTSSIINALPFLSIEQCWQILEKRVFRGETCPPMLESIGMDIAAKCKGLPLIATVIAGILSDVNREPNSWNIVRDEVHSYGFLVKTNPTMQILELSYKHLSQHLRPCLLYFGIFQEDPAIPTKKLKQLWIAEGFIHKHKLKDPKEDREKVAEEYLMELINKSLVMVAKKGSNGRVKACAMHDLLREMCSRIAEEENFFKRISTRGQMSNLNSRHIWLDSEPLKFNRLVVQSKSIYLQPIGPWIRSFIYLDLPVETIFVGNMKLLRVLDCWGRPYQFCQLVGIENLVKLRYLATRKVPKSIENLVNLEYLIVDREVHIPSLIQKMLKLRYLKALSVKLDNDCDIFPANNLKFLSLFQIKNARDEEFLKYLPHLRKLKCKYVISQKVKSASPSFDLRFLTHLLSLSVTSFRSKMTTIKFPKTIRRLTLNRLYLSWEKISMIGELPNLEILKLENDAFVGERWVTREGEFKKLRILKVRFFRKLEKWNVSSKEHFPNLQQLFLNYCLSLKKIPREIGNIETLQLIEVSSCKASVAKSVLEIAEEQEDWGNDSLKVLISDTLRDDGLNVPQG